MTMKREDDTATGIVLRIEKTSMYDGQGLRTVVYLKGCPLRCQWCSTPESQAFLPELGYDAGRCRSCMRCVENCGVGAIAPVPQGTGIRIDDEKCTRCFDCAEACPAGAFKPYGFRKTIGEIIREVEKDEVFYFHSGGGITLTGGEPLAQIEFARQLLQACRDRGINTAVETAGFVPWESFEKVLPLIDLLYFDLKHMDPAQHKKLTGQENHLILENLQKIDRFRMPVNLIVRVPLIPGLNDSRENLIATALFCKSLKNLKTLEVLPYHRFGIETYGSLGREYALKDLRTQDIDILEEKVQLIRDTGLEVPVTAGGAGA